MDGWILRRVRASDGCREEGEGREACLQGGHGGEVTDWAGDGGPAMVVLVVVLLSAIGVEAIHPSEPPAQDNAADHSKAPPNLGDGFLENPSGPPPKRGDGLGNSLNFTLFVEAAGPRLELLRRPLGPLEPQAWHSPAQEPTPGASTSLNGERPSSMESLELGRTARPARQHRTLGLLTTDLLTPARQSPPRDRLGARSTRRQHMP
ncbi:hypothetical protein Purlil1_9225 [Purpureocillium lilacinum]|uniref:Uncharacterized protein n=1 Tax=Purpureocillium lilacinum TaxID=33203 RepID=A0ABR0BQR4_PURLI|nr:hypothetical protein Purlil1_9225 [Purpureocillium lilacinum]